MSGNTTIFGIRAALCSIDDIPGFLLILKEISQKFDTHIICFNADMLAGKRHAESAVLHAIRSFREGCAISNTIEMEALLYAAGSRQCSIAASFGLRAGEPRLWACCYPQREGVWEALTTVLHIQGDDFRDCIDQEKRERLTQIFDIKPEELASLDIRIGSPILFSNGLHSWMFFDEGYRVAAFFNFVQISSHQTSFCTLQGDLSKTLLPETLLDAFKSPGIMPGQVPV